MILRIKGTGQVEDFIPSIAFYLLASGRAELVKSVVEVAAIIPQNETAAITAPSFKRVLKRKQIAAEAL